MSVEVVEQDWTVAIDSQVHAIALEHTLKNEPNVTAVVLKVDGQPISRRHMRVRRAWSGDISDWHFHLGRHPAFVRIDGSREPYRYDLVIDGHAVTDGERLVALSGSRIPALLVVIALLLLVLLSSWLLLPGLIPGS